MQYNPLGKTDLRVSRLCLGCMTFGEPDRGNHAWTLPEESSRPIIKRALEGGINFFDTANSYSDGSSEGIVGRALRDFARREDVVVATKVFHRVGDLPEGLSRAQILRSIDDSLRRLGRVVPCVTALVQPGPSDYLIGTRLHVEGDGVPLVQLALLDPPLEKEVSFLVAEEERNEVYLMLESVGEFHIIVVLEIQAELAKRQRVVVYPIASV